MAGTTLTALHGDTWLSPRWAVALDGQPADLSQWVVRAQARQTADAADVLVEWTVPGGGVLLGSALVRLASGTEITTGTVQLRLRPADWAALPRRWSGVVEVEIASDDTAAPADRRTIVPARKLTITPDVTRSV